MSPLPPTSPPPLDLSELFNCSICLELVYKPIVQACGHIFCFWCVHHAMNHGKESHCPICRRPYMYFPRICQLLHFMLAKACSDEYEKRGQEIRCTEEEKQVYSPHLELKHSWSPSPSKDYGTWKADEIISVSTPPKDVHIPESVPVLQVNCLESVPVSKDADSGSSVRTSIQYSLTVFDFLCSSCHRLLHNPVVLNCGEVFCSSCVERDVDAGLYCPSCKDSQPGGSVSVCLELHHFLESAFPMEYMNRRQADMHQVVEEKTRLNGKLSVMGTWPTGSLHQGVGCDGCGMFPIIGERYMCTDCPDSIGFDLCEACYRKGGDLLGRFNQAHKSDHQMIKFTVHPVLDIHNSTIQRRRQQQQIMQRISDLDDDLDDYIESIVG